MNTTPTSYPFTCQHCKTTYTVSAVNVPLFCPFCNTPAQSLSKEQDQDLIDNRYKIIKDIGKGGMGEVLLAYDNSCDRQIALKRIRPDLTQHPQVQSRFLKEARITGQLTHPAIIPIYTIHGINENTYYTMPFVEGETLKQLIRKTKLQEKNGEQLDHVGGSIPALMRIFLTICQAVAYAHSKNILHRDLKLENVIIGKYGEVLILDWGLAKHINPLTENPENEFSSESVKVEHNTITRTGKVVGTIAYMAPEIAFAHPATEQTDIYSLGVILYQLLTLKPPFKRPKALEEFKKGLAKEKWVDPIVAAPYRDVPHILSRIAKKCLSAHLNERYATVDDLIHDMKNYIEGRSEWFYINQLDINKKSDWEFQENILIAEHMAITRLTEESIWVNLMISGSSFTGNTKIETNVCIEENGRGIGFLLSIPEAIDRVHLNEGYCLWLGSDLNRATKLLRSNVEVVDAPDIFLKRNRWYRISIEKIEHSIHLYIDDVLQLSYIAHIPLMGTHIGLLAQDADFSINPLNVFVGSLNLTVNCLAVPDAFLAHRDFNQALSEYRRIAYSFPDRVEGREAIFRTGLTYIEQAKLSTNLFEQEKLLDLARGEFEKLHSTPGGPLEYLGKSMVYQVLNDEIEEVKCFELAYRKYPKHPLLPILQEQIISRMHEVSRYHRMAAYSFILLTTRNLPLKDIDIHTRRLFTGLQKHWEHLPFIEENPSKNKALHYVHFEIQLAFWLGKPYLLGEILNDLNHESTVSEIETGNALCALIELGSWKYAQEKIQLIRELPHNKESVVQDTEDVQHDKERALHDKDGTLQKNVINENLHFLTSLDKIIACYEKKPLKSILSSFFPDILKNPSFQDWRAFQACLNYAIDTRQTALLHEYAQAFNGRELPFEMRLQLDIQRIWAYLLEKNWIAAGEIMSVYPLEMLNQESSTLHFLYACLLQATEGKEISDIHLTGILNIPFPRSWTLASHYLIENLTPDSPWFFKAFLWEKKQLYRHLALYYNCSGNEEKMYKFQKLYQQQYIHAKH